MNDATFFKVAAQITNDLTPKYACDVITALRKMEFNDDKFHAIMDEIVLDPQDLGPFAQGIEKMSVVVYVGWNEEAGMYHLWYDYKYAHSKEAGFGSNGIDVKRVVEAV